ncbi:hypothetical protein N0V85_006601 [Neurospora sp. IMI 360204]|nr:hypothetical protein N0V85_006601 [Neurospora sp. IMI 360204]
MTDPKDLNERHLRFLYFVLLFAGFTANWATGYDSAIMNSVQELGFWNKYFGYPVKDQLGPITAMYSLGALCSKRSSRYWCSYSSTLLEAPEKREEAREAREVKAEEEKKKESKKFKEAEERVAKVEEELEKLKKTVEEMVKKIEKMEKEKERERPEGVSTGRLGWVWEVLVAQRGHSV